MTPFPGKRVLPTTISIAAPQRLDPGELGSFDDVASSKDPLSFKGILSIPGDARRVPAESL